MKERAPATAEDAVGMSVEELRALEEASIEAADATAKAPTKTPEGDGEKAVDATDEDDEKKEEGKKDEKKDGEAEDGEAKPKVPSRRPIAPPKTP